MILLFLAGFGAELIGYAFIRLAPEKRPRRAALVGLTLLEYAMWGFVIRRIALDDWTAIVPYALGGMVGVLAGTFVPRRGG